MREVAFLGTENSALVLQTGDGEKLTLPVDEALRAAIRNMPSTNSNTGVSPRQIQDAIREGLTPTHLASKYGVDESFVLKFATPILEELDHMVRSALSVRIDTGADKFNEPQLVEFGTLVASRLAQARAKDLAWSAKRNSPTTWLIVGSYVIDGIVQEATWLFDPRSFVLTPESKLAIALSNYQVLLDQPIPQVSALHPSASAQVDEEDEEVPVLDAFKARREAVERSALLEKTTTAVEDTPEPENEEFEEVTETENEKPEPPSKRGRAPMPSWDDIVFGAKSED